MGDGPVLASPTLELPRRGRSCPRHPHAESHAKYFTVVWWMRANDPSAGSPTETLLRLLLPLSDKVH